MVDAPIPPGVAGAAQLSAERIVPVGGGVAAVRGAPDRGPPAVNRAAITISIMLATIMQAIDTTIANVALPHIQGSLSAAQDQITWILTSYIVAAAIMTPLTGWLAGALWHQGRLSDLGRRLYPDLGAVRPGRQPPPDGALSLAARDMWRGVIAVGIFWPTLLGWVKNRREPENRADSS